MENDYAISVTQLNDYLKNIIDAEELLFNIKVFGEVSGFSVSRNIAYFSIKDENAILSCVCFDKEQMWEKIKEGDKVVLMGTPKFYAKGGKLNFNVTKIETIGMGELYKQFLVLKEQLTAAGFFDNVRKKKMPEKINKIGVVTSKTGAVLQDIYNITSRRNSNVELYLVDVKVQGANSEKEIAKGIELFNDFEVDAVIVARGGGSKEDLAPFNTLEVAQAVYNSNKFIVSAVGHEVDFSIVDMVADMRAPTPSAAAELLVKDKMSEIKLAYAKFNNTFYRFESMLDNKIQNIINLCGDLSVKYENVLLNNENNVRVMAEQLIKLNPENILLKGYGKIFKNGKVVSSVSHLKKEDLLTINLLDGKINVKIEQIEGDA